MAEKISLSRSFPTKQLAPPALITLITLLLYYPGLGGPFLLDDFANIIDNTALHIGTLSFSSLWEAAFSSDAGPLRRPVAMFTFALNYYFDGLSPIYYKAVNIGIHLATAIGLFFLTEALLRRLAGYATTAPGILSPRQLAAFITVLWALHPLHVSTVLYVVQRMTELAALFSVVGVLLYVRGREMLIAGKQRDGIILVALGAIGCGMLAALSKENGALLPVLLLLVEALFFRGTRVNQPVAKLVFVLLALQTAAILAYLLYVWTGPSNPTRGFTSTERLLTETRILFSYAGQILLPRIDQMSLFDESTAVSRGLFAPPGTAAAVIAMLALISGSLWAAFKNRATPLVFGVGWFLAGHLLESTVIPLELRFEHRNYLPSYGLLFAVGYGIAHSQIIGRLRPALHYSLALALVLGTGALLQSKVSQWSSMSTLIRHELLRHPESARAWTTLAFTESLQGHYLSAATLYEKAAVLEPQEAGHLIGALILRLCEIGEPPRPEMVSQVTALLGRYPISSYGNSQLRLLAASVIKKPAPDSAAQAAISAVLRSAAQNSLGLDSRLRASLFFLSGELAIQHRDWNQAIQALREGINIMPFDARLLMLAETLALAERYSEAKAELEKIRPGKLDDPQRVRYGNLRQILMEQPAGE